MDRVKTTYRSATPQELAAQAGPFHVVALEPAQEIEDHPEVGKDHPEVGEDLLNSDLERETEKYGKGEEDLPADPKIEFDVSSETQILNQANLDRIRRTYRILKAVHSQLVSKSKDLAWPLAGGGRV